MMKLFVMANLNQHINGSGSEVVTYRSNFTIQMAAILIMNSSVSSLIHMQIVKTIIYNQFPNYI